MSNASHGVCFTSEGSDGFGSLETQSIFQALSYSMLLRTYDLNEIFEYVPCNDFSQQWIPSPNREQMLERFRIHINTTEKLLRETCDFLPNWINTMGVEHERYTSLQSIRNQVFRLSLLFEFHFRDPVAGINRTLYRICVLKILQGLGNIRAQGKALALEYSRQLLTLSNLRANGNAAFLMPMQEACPVIARYTHFTIGGLPALPWLDLSDL